MAGYGSWGHALANPRARHDVIRALAGGANSEEVAAKYGCQPETVRKFKERNKDAIEALIGKLDDQWAHLWVADKRWRMTELQRDIENINTHTGRYMEALASAIENKDFERLQYMELDPAMIRAKAALLRQAAEEMGDLKQNVDLTAKVTYTLKGVNTDDLS